ncbi:MAG: hypothetical protein ACOX3T_03460 [Bdellovibrionota bacterium]
MKLKKFLKIFFKILIALCSLFLFFYLIALLFENNSFDKLSDGEPFYSACFLDLEDVKKEDRDNILVNALKEDLDLYVIKSKLKSKDKNIASSDIVDLNGAQKFYKYSQSLSSNLTILSKFKLGKNRAKLNNNFFNPIYTGYLELPKRRILFSFLSTKNLSPANESESFRKYLILRRNFTEFRGQERPILFLANWNISFLSLRRWLHYLEITPKNYIYNLYAPSDSIQVFKSSNYIKVYDVKKDKFGIKVFFNVS